MKPEVLKEFIDTIPVEENWAVRQMTKRYNVPGGKAVKSYRRLLKTSKNEQAIQSKRKKAINLTKTNPEAALKLYSEIDSHLDKLRIEIRDLPDADEQDKKWVRARFNISTGAGSVRDAADFETKMRQKAFKKLANKIK